MALLKSGLSPQDPAVAKGLKYLEDNVQPSGGIYGKNSRIPNYETCIGIMCFEAANADGKYDEIIAAANKAIRAGQYDAADDVDKDNFYYGGTGYAGSKGRPDLSNTAFLIDALKAAGADGDDEAIQKALVFVSRCQNLETEHNQTPLAAKVNDGGFYYAPSLNVSADDPAATANGGLRSYGTMSYAGLKSLLYAGLTQDDPRVKAATDWIRKHYNVESNPGMGNAGLYYYYHVFAKALEAWGQDVIVDDKDKEHNWRAELADHLIKRQNKDGSWVNMEDRWYEGSPQLVTGYAVLALETILK